MKKIEVHLDDSGHPVDVHFDDGNGTPIQAFVFLSSVPTSPPMSHILTYGNSDVVGRLLFSFWANSVNKDPGGAWVIEEVCKDIIKAADSARENEWPGKAPDKVM